MSRKTVSVLIFSTWIAGVVYLNGLLNHQKINFKIPADQPSFIWPPELYRVLAVGQVPAAVDALLLKFLVEDNIKHVEAGVRARVYYFLDLATELDPAFFSLYTAGTNFLAVARNDKDSALKLITKGENFRKNILPKSSEVLHEVYWRDEWRIPFLKGYVHLFEMGDLRGAEAAYHELETLPGVPIGVRYLSQRFAKPGGIYDVGLSVLRNMIADATDDTVLRELKLKQRSLTLSHELFLLNEEYKTYKGTWENFKRAKSIPDVDPLGGKIFLGKNGKIDTTSERLLVLGIR